jgi:hypothetical protein
LFAIISHPRHAPDFVLSGSQQPPLSLMYYDFYHVCSQTHVIAIRGSQTLHDWLTDVGTLIFCFFIVFYYYFGYCSDLRDLWMESVLYSVSKKLFPLFPLIEDESEALIIKYAVVVISFDDVILFYSVLFIDA